MSAPGTPAEPWTAYPASPPTTKKGNVVHYARRFGIQSVKAISKKRKDILAESGQNAPATHLPREPMPFPPHVQRVIYEKNPLIEVSFQVRFPRFLSIETEAPSEFQKLIIGQFPIYEQRQVFQISISIGGSERSDVHGKMHAFQSSDRNVTIILASDSLAVSCSHYKSWEEFIPLVTKALDSFQRTYRLPIVTRVGLRYVNVVSRDALGLSDRSWSDLLQPHIAGGFLGPSLAEPDVLAKTTVLTVKLADGDQVLLRHGLVTQNETKKIAYLIDSDFYNEEQRDAGLDATLEIASRLHTNSGRLFRWCISDQLHVAMDPKPVSETR